MVFHWRLSDNKSPQVSRTLLSILAVFNNAVVWMVSTRPPTFKSSRPFNSPLVTVPKAPITIGIIVTFVFHSFFNSLARSRYLLLLLSLLLLLLLLFRFPWWSRQNKIRLILGIRLKEKNIKVIQATPFLSWGIEKELSPVDSKLWDCRNRKS